MGRIRLTNPDHRYAAGLRRCPPFLRPRSQERKAIVYTNDRMEPSLRPVGTMSHGVGVERQTSKGRQNALDSPA